MDHPVTEQRSAGEGVRSPSGTADNREALEAELVGNRLDVGGGVGNRPAGTRVGAAVTGPVVDDCPHVVPLVDAGVRVAREPAARRAVRKDHRDAVGASPLEVSEGAPVVRRQGRVVLHRVEIIRAIRPGERAPARPLAARCTRAA